MACRLLIVISLMAAALTAHPTRASDRVALVIGNADYAHVPRLANPLNDAGDMGAALARLGFAVTILENTGSQDMRRGLQEFRRAASGAAMAVVFYAGHGIEVDKRNFLVPVDARFRTDGDIKYEAVPLDLVVDTLEGVTGLRMVILDACRDNPFLADMERVGSTRTIGRGLARVEPSGEMLVVAYAAMGGTVALDGKGRNSPYTEALLAHLEEPGLELGLMFRKVSEAVRKTTGNSQQPVTYDNLPSAGIYLAGLPPPPKPDLAPDPAPDPGDNGGTGPAAQDAYEAAKQLGTPEAFEAFAKHYEDSFYAALARGQIARLTDPEAVETALGLETDDYALVQLALDAAAFRLGRIDGKFGPRSRGALKRWQASKGYPATGFLTGKQLADLREKGRDIEARDKARAEAEGAARGRILQDRHGTQAMHEAARKGHVDAMRWLQAQGADVNARNDYGSTPMHLAAHYGHVDAMRWLQAQGADVNARDKKYGDIPMHDAAWNGQVDAMRWLQAQGADVNAQDDNGNTPMHRAAERGHVDAMRWLQAQGADVNARDDYGRTPLGAAERGGETKAANWLRANGGRK